MKDGIVSVQNSIEPKYDFADAPTRSRNASQALQVLLRRRAIPIINENDTIAIEEIKVGDNDNLFCSSCLSL